MKLNFKEICGKHNENRDKSEANNCACPEETKEDVKEYKDKVFGKALYSSRRTINSAY